MFGLSTLTVSQPISELKLQIDYLLQPEMFLYSNVHFCTSSAFREGNKQWNSPTQTIRDLINNLRIQEKHYRDKHCVTRYSN